jgi:hypothetical protein
VKNSRRGLLPTKAVLLRLCGEGPTLATTDAQVRGSAREQNGT